MPVARDDLLEAICDVVVCHTDRVSLELSHCTGKATQADNMIPVAGRHERTLKLGSGLRQMQYLARFLARWALRTWLTGRSGALSVPFPCVVASHHGQRVFSLPRCCCRRILATASWSSRSLARMNAALAPNFGGLCEPRTSKRSEGVEQRTGFRVEKPPSYSPRRGYDVSAAQSSALTSGVNGNSAVIPWCVPSGSV